MGVLDFISKLTASKETTPFDPSVFNDELATKTSWSPLVDGGSNFKGKTLKHISSLEIHFVASIFGKLFL